MVDKRNIFLIGPMGAGKSTVGRYLSKQLNMEFFDSDKEIEKRTGADISWVFDVEGEEGFRIREEKVIDELTQKLNIVLATGGGSILSSLSRNQLSARGIVIYLETTVEKQLLRTQRDKKRPLLQQTYIEKPIEILQRLAKIRNPLYEEIADIKICTDNKTTKIVVNNIVNILLEQN